MENNWKNMRSQLHDNLKISMNNRATWLCCFLFFGAFAVHAQTTFNLNYQGVWQSGYRTCNVLEDGYLLSGWTLDTVSNQWHYDVFTHRLASEGILTNQNHFGELERWIVTDNANGISFRENEFIQVGHGGHQDTLRLFLLWFNEDGDTIRTRTYLSPNIGETTAQWEDYFFPNYAVLTATGEVYVCSEIGTATTGNDIFVMKTDAEGNELWRYVYAHDDNDLALTLLPFTDGIIVGGVATWTGETESAGLIIKLDSNGNLDWHIPTLPFSVLYHPEAFLNDNGAIVTVGGFKEENAPFSYTSISTVIKLDTLGGVIWQTPFSDYIDGAGKQFSTLIQTPDSNFVAAGSWWEYSGILNEWGEEILEYYTHLIKVNKENGDIIWERYYNLAPLQDGVTHEIYDMKPTPDGGLIFCGEVIADFGPGQPYQQGWVCKLDACGCLVPGCDGGCIVGVQEMGAQPFSAGEGWFLVGPNPARDYINIYLRLTPPDGYRDSSAGEGAAYPPTSTFDIQHSLFDIRNSTFVIHDLLGNEIKSFAPHRADTTYIVDTTGLAGGQYVVSLVSEGAVLQSEKIVVAR